jgi:1-acyl-sn-glycerol-3-phosphate acyltransferase
MPKGAKFIFPRKLHVIVGEPITVSTAGTAKEQREAMRAVTVQLHDEMQRLFDLAQTRSGN